MKNFRKIVIHGDSNGLHYYQALIDLVQNSFSCKQMREKEKGRKPGDLDPYFQIPGGPIEQRFKGCSHCDSITNVCQLKDSSSSFYLIIEYIGMVALIDNAIYTQALKTVQQFFLEGGLSLNI